MAKFNPGDIVRCINDDDGCQKGITKGNTYKIVEYKYTNESWKTLVRIIDDMHKQNEFFAVRFVLVKPEIDYLRITREIVGRPL
jgi:hypothetical protein